MDGGGTATLTEMIAATKRGLLLTCLWYIRDVDPERLLLTGLTRDGVYLIEDGVVVGAVNNFRWNESPVELLGRITEVGAAELTLCREWNDFFNRTVMPPDPGAGLQHVDGQPGQLTPLRPQPTFTSGSRPLRGLQPACGDCTLRLRTLRPGAFGLPGSGPVVPEFRQDRGG